MKITNNGTLEGIQDPRTKEPSELNLIPHPNTLFAVPVIERETKSGIILPESYTAEKASTPIAEVFAIGANVEKQLKDAGFDLSVGDLVYLNPAYMNFAEIDEVKGIVTMADGIHGKLK